LCQNIVSTVVRFFRRRPSIRYCCYGNWHCTAGSKPI